MPLLLVLALAIAAAGATVWGLGQGEPSRRLGRANPAWFVVVRDRGAASAPRLADGVRILWSSRIDMPFVGAEEAYWDRCLILGGGAPDAWPIVLGDETEDAYVARVRLLRPPAMALGLIKTLTRTGLLGKPKGPPLTDAAALGLKADTAPTKAQAEALVAKPAIYHPAMVNFLRYFDQARYPGGSNQGPTGAEAYARYGLVALRSVYRTGGQLVFYGKVTGVLREAASGPTVGRWDEVAAMQYRAPAAVLTMEQLPDYRAALVHRDAGLEKSVVLASIAD